jgi:hypothetical protein
MIRGRGFLLVEVCVSLLLLGIFSCLLFSWHATFTTRQALIIHRLKALSIARTALERALQHRSPSKVPFYKIALLRKNLIPGYTQCTVVVSREGKQLITLTSGVANNAIWFNTY